MSTPSAGGIPSAGDIPSPVAERFVGNLFYDSFDYVNDQPNPTFQINGKYFSISGILTYLLILNTNVLKVNNNRLNHTAQITKLSRHRFSKTLVLVKSRV
jgi:hypothetical protein